MAILILKYMGSRGLAVEDNASMGVPIIGLAPVRSTSGEACLGPL